MVHQSLPDLSRNELDVMKLLWKRGGLSAREIHDTLGEGHSWSYSTTRTVLDRMVKKELLSKKSFHGLNLFQPLVSKAAGLARFVRTFAEEVLEMEMAPVVSLFTDSKALNPEELDELMAILDEGEKR